MSLVWPRQTRRSRSYITLPSCSVPPRPALPRGLVSRERCEYNIYMDLTRTSYEGALQLYCLNSCWIHLWTMLLKFAFLRRSDVLESSVIFHVDSLDIQSSMNSNYHSSYPISNFVLNKSEPPSDATSNTTRAYLRATLLTQNLHNSSTPPWRCSFKFLVV